MVLFSPKYSAFGQSYRWGDVGIAPYDSDNPTFFDMLTPALKGAGVSMSKKDSFYWYQKVIQTNGEVL